MVDPNTRAEDSQRRAAELQRQVVDSNRRADTSSGRADGFQRRAESSEARVHQLERSLAETTQDLRQSEDRYQIAFTHWAVRREEIELTGPDSIVHRGISSANILLEVIQHNKWRAELTDYGSVKVVRQLRTEKPGSQAYAAAEASNPRLQSPKMDMYSFGALILEMLTARLPTPDDRPGMFRKVQHEQFLRLIRKCLSENPDHL